MSDDQPTLAARYSLARLDSERLYRLLDIAAERHNTACRFWDWLSCNVRGELCRRHSFVDGQIPIEAAPLDLVCMLGWENRDLFQAHQAALLMNESIEDLELSLLFQKLMLMTVALVGRRMSATEAVPDETSTDWFGLE